MDKNNRGYIIFSPDGTKPKATVACFYEGKGEGCIIEASGIDAIKLAGHIIFCVRQALKNIPDAMFEKKLKTAYDIAELEDEMKNGKETRMLTEDEITFISELFLSREVFKDGIKDNI